MYLIDSQWNNHQLCVFPLPSMAWNLCHFYSVCYSLRHSKTVASAASAKQRYYFSNQQNRWTSVADTYPAKMLKEGRVPTGKEPYYNSRCSDPEKEAQGTSTPRSVCRRMPAHGLYFCAVSTLYTVWWMVNITPMHAVVAILATILMRSIYQRTVARTLILTPVAPHHYPPTQDLSSLL